MWGRHPACEGQHAKSVQIVVGDGGVGKSAITIQFIQGRFEEEYDVRLPTPCCLPFLAKNFHSLQPTIEDTYQKFLEVDKRKVCLNVVDTAGFVFLFHPVLFLFCKWMMVLTYASRQEDYRAMRDTWFRTGDGFILVIASFSR
jgi:GTPase SAR1 family protein